jgi:hypothetical protein
MQTKGESQQAFRKTSVRLHPLISARRLSRINLRVLAAFRATTARLSPA